MRQSELESLFCLSTSLKCWGPQILVTPWCCLSWPFGHFRSLCWHWSRSAFGILRLYLVWELHICTEKTSYKIQFQQHFILCNFLIRGYPKAPQVPNLLVPLQVGYCVMCAGMWQCLLRIYTFQQEMHVILISRYFYFLPTYNYIAVFKAITNRNYKKTTILLFIVH